MATLNSETVRVGKLFGDEFFFTIPNYQRPFSWDDDQLRDLIDDLAEADKTNDYFFGTLVLHHTPQGSYDVVDGQQRLTALSILLACLRDLLETDAEQVQELIVQPEKKFQGIPSRVRLTVRDSEPFERIVCSRGGTKDITQADNNATAAERRYINAVKIFRETLDGKSQEDLEGFVQFVAQRVVVIYLAADTFDDAFRLFTVVNDRGKQLRRIDVLKAKNLSPAEMPDSWVREEYARKWESYEESLGENDFEALFHALRLMYIQEKPEGDLLQEFAKKVYGKVGKPSPGKSFVNELGEFVDLYDSIFGSRDYLDGTPDHAFFKTLMFSMVNEFRASEWRACVLSYARKFKTDGFLGFILRIERLFVDHWVRGVRKDERYSSYTAILKAIDASKKADAVTSVMDVDLKAIQQACRSTNLYGAGYVKYLLVRAEIQAAELSAPREFSPRSIEHVLPQTPKTGGTWKTWFNDADVVDLVHTAGNLVLLSKAKNSSAQNKEFEDKKEAYLAPRVSDYPRSVAVLGYSKWTPEIIRARTEEFAAGILSRP